MRARRARGVPPRANAGRAPPPAGRRRTRRAPSGAATPPAYAPWTLRRRSRNGRALVTYGMRSKFHGGGGDVVYHSSVSASHGSFAARAPARAVFTTLTTNRSRPSVITPEPIVDRRL